MSPPGTADTLNHYLALALAAELSALAGRAALLREILDAPEGSPSDAATSAEESGGGGAG